MEVPEMVNAEVGDIGKAVVGNERSIDGVEQSPTKASAPDGVVLDRIDFLIHWHFAPP
jgi:hypothetical protein